MRKDLRYGLGIGALLLAFLATYLLVRNHTENQATLLGRSGADSVEGGPAEANPPGEFATDNAASNAASSIPPRGPLTRVEPVRTESPTSTDAFAPRPSGLPVKPTPTRPVPSSANASQDWERLLSTPRTDPMAGSSRPRTVASQRTGEAAADAPRRVETPTRSTERVAPPVVAPPVSETRDESSARPAVSTRTGRPYTVRDGDTFVSIAKVAYGNTKYFLQIEKANPNVNPSRLKIGQTIVLPDLSIEARASKPGPFDHSDDNRPINPETEYRVDTGDSLYRISMQVYGTPRMIDSIYEANRTAIGPNRERLRLGMILKMPRVGK